MHLGVNRRGIENVVLLVGMTLLHTMHLHVRYVVDDMRMKRWRYVLLIMPR